MTTESNIIIDGDFEEGFDGWVLSSQSSIFVEDGATGNNHFCRIEPTNNHYANTLPLSPKPPIG
nr:Uncharacterised protein [Salmonella sp. NCTC 7297]